MADKISIHVKCFSHIKQALGVDELNLTVSAGSTCSDLEKEIRTMAQGKLDNISFRFAVNLVFKPSDQVLENGDEVALIPPVQGG